jgi:hypothetical protein
VREEKGKKEDIGKSREQRGERSDHDEERREA